MTEMNNRFLAMVPEGGAVLDFGCGAGRDSKYFCSKGYKVTAVDGSMELAQRASEFAGIHVRCEDFREFNDLVSYDGIWACASLLHLKKSEIPGMLKKLAGAMHAGGVLYTSFKYGSFEGMRDGRYYTDLTPGELVRIAKKVPELTVKEVLTTKDVRTGKDTEWLNVFWRKS